MKKLAIFLMSVFLVFTISGTSFAVPFQVGTGGYLKETVTSGPGLLANWTALGTGVFELGEGITSGDIDLFRIKVPLALAEGTVNAYVELLSPDPDVDIMGTGNFKVFSFFLFSGGELKWTDPSPVSYSYAGLTNGSLSLDLIDIPKEWQCGTTFTISGRFTNIQDPSAAPVPEPSTILLMGAGLLGLVAVGRRKFNRKE